jgi:hypothetical protein
MSRVLPDLSRKMLDLVELFAQKDNVAIAARLAEVYRDLETTHTYYRTLLEAIGDELEAGAGFADLAKPVLDTRFERELLRAVVSAAAGVLYHLPIEKTYRTLFGRASDYLRDASVARFFFGEEPDGPFDGEALAAMMKYHQDYGPSSEVLDRLGEAAWREPFGHDQTRERRRIIAQSRRALFQLQRNWTFVVQAYSELSPFPVPPRCPLCGALTAYVETHEGPTHVFACAQHGRLILPPNGPLRQDPQ